MKSTRMNCPGCEVLYSQLVHVEVVEIADRKAVVIQTIFERVDCHSFYVSQDSVHVLACDSDRRYVARKSAAHIYLIYLFASRQILKKYLVVYSLCGEC